MAKGRGNARLFMVLIGLILLINIQVEGSYYIVGANNGWAIGYKKFSATTKFKAGDKLVFNYSKLHNVVQVIGDKDYKNCVVSKGARTYNSGKDKIVLKRGLNYFICSVPGHCQGGLKLKVQAY